MASLEDYDEFGNYIGADLDSDEDDGIKPEPVPQETYEHQRSYTPLEGYDEQGQDSMALMEVDG